MDVRLAGAGTTETVGLADVAEAAISDGGQLAAVLMSAAAYAALKRRVVELEAELSSCNAACSAERTARQNRAAERRRDGQRGWDQSF